MDNVTVGATVALDGVHRRRERRCRALFDWYSSGDVATTMADPDTVFRVSAASAGYIDSATGNIGAFVIGRRLLTSPTAGGASRRSAITSSS